MIAFPQILAAAAVLALARDASAKTSPVPGRPPWEGSYKIRPEETARLTGADVVGPDGIVYPDWTYAGVQGGIPTVKVEARAEECGARPDDDLDDSSAFQRAIDALAGRGGGALLIGRGTFHLDRPIEVTSDRVVIRGAGRDATRLIFRYKDGPSASERVRFFSPARGDVIDRNAWIEIHCWYEDVMRLAILVDDKPLCERRRSAHWGATFALGASGREAIRLAGEGGHVLKGIAEYRDGTIAETRLDVVIEPRGARERRRPQAVAAILFRGAGRSGKPYPLAADGARGAREIALACDHDLRAGDCIFLSAPATERWKRLTGNLCEWGSYRDYTFVVEGVEGRTLRLNQPMRIEYPIIDGAHVQRWTPLRGCGVEGFHLEHVVPHWLSGVEFRDAIGSWARDLRVHRPGRHAVMFTASKWCEIRDCEFADSWHPLQGGGSAYVGWQHDCDCLMENCASSRMRHGPCVQWAAAGNVIRDSTFFMSDGQWHAGWCAENLFENCVIDAATGTGSYGYGFWASPPEDKAHGPEGPRNVIYNCDVRSPKGSLWMGGMNENWIVVYNRLEAKTGASVFAKTCSFDHILRGNAFVLGDARQPAVFLADRSCIGVEIVDNVIAGGGGKLVGGAGEPLVARGNLFRAAGAVPRPVPPVRSIFEWQRRNR